MYRTQPETDAERSLRYDLENAQEELRREREEQKQRTEQNRREWQEHMNEVRRTAETWPEALRKQAGLFSHEAASYPCDDAGHIPGEGYNRENDYFATGTDACNRALVLWNEADKFRQRKRLELQKQLDALEMEIRNEVADKLDAEHGDKIGWHQVAIALRDQDHSPSEWLNW